LEGFIINAKQNSPPTPGSVFRSEASRETGYAEENIAQNTVGDDGARRRVDVPTAERHVWAMARVGGVGGGPLVHSCGLPGYLAQFFSR